MKSMIYKLKNESTLMPYEIEIWDQLDGSPIPDWFTDVLQLKYFNENGQPEFQFTKDDKGITYRIPSTNGHLYLPNKCILARDIHLDNIFPLERTKFDLYYELKLSKWEKMKCRLEYIINMILGKQST